MKIRRLRYGCFTTGLSNLQNKKVLCCHFMKEKWPNPKKKLVPDIVFVRR